MTAIHQTIWTDILVRLVIDTMCLSQHIIVGHQNRTDLLVTILGKFLTERRRGIQTGVKGSLDL